MAIETKRIRDTNVIRALAEFETAVRAGWSLDHRGSALIGTVMSINLVRGAKAEVGVVQDTPKGVVEKVVADAPKVEVYVEVEGVVTEVTPKKTARKAKQEV